MLAGVNANPPFDRPEVMNALNTRMGRDLLDLWTRLTEDPEDVRRLVPTGTADRHEGVRAFDEKRRPRFEGR